MIKQALIIFMILVTGNVKAQSKSVKEQLISIIGKENSFVFDHYRKNDDNDSFIKKLISLEKTHSPTFREKKTSYKELRRKYLAHSLYQHFKSNEPSRSIASITKEDNSRLKFEIPQYLGLIFFKKNEIKKVCTKVVDKAVSMGAKGVAFFYPVHYSGGNSEKEFMPKKPVYGKDYKYEYAQAPLEKNVFNCIDYIVENDLQINWVPHLESIASLESSGKSEWRMYSGVPLDQHYYINAFGPLLSYVKRTNNRKKLLSSLRITFAAEIDNMALGRPKDSIRIIDNLNREMKKYTSKKVPILLNTNGDFYHLWKIPQVKKSEVSCLYINRLISKVDMFSPSMYGDKGHFKKSKKNNLSVNKTLNSYLSSFSNAFPKECKSLSKTIRSVDIGFGEFALDLKKKQKYSDILSMPKRIKYVQYWNHSIWDHLGVIDKASSAAQSQLLSRP